MKETLPYVWGRTAATLVRGLVSFVVQQSLPGTYAGAYTQFWPTHLRRILWYTIASTLK